MEQLIAKPAQKQRIKVPEMKELITNKSCSPIRKYLIMSENIWSPEEEKQRNYNRYGETNSPEAVSDFSGRAPTRIAASSLVLPHVKHDTKQDRTVSVLELGDSQSAKIRTECFSPEKIKTQENKQLTSEFESISDAPNSDELREILPASSSDTQTNEYEKKAINSGLCNYRFLDELNQQNEYFIEIQRKGLNISGQSELERSIFLRREASNEAEELYLQLYEGRISSSIFEQFFNILIRSYQEDQEITEEFISSREKNVNEFFNCKASDMNIRVVCNLLGSGILKELQRCMENLETVETEIPFSEYLILYCYFCYTNYSSILQEREWQNSVLFREFNFYLSGSKNGIYKELSLGFCLLFCMNYDFACNSLNSIITAIEKLINIIIYTIEKQAIKVRQEEEELEMSDYEDQSYELPEIRGLLLNAVRERQDLSSTETLEEKRVETHISKSVYHVQVIEQMKSNLNFMLFMCTQCFYYCSQSAEKGILAPAEQLIIELLQQVIDNGFMVDVKLSKNEIKISELLAKCGNLKNGKVSMEISAGVPEMLIRYKNFSTE